MRKLGKRWMAICMAAVMLFSLLPGAALAEELPNSEDTILLPIGEESANDLELLSADNTLYLPRHTTQVELPEMTLPEGTYSDTARLQLLDADGAVIATTGDDFYIYSDYTTGAFPLYFLEDPEASVCSFQIADGTAEQPVIVPLDMAVEVTDAPVLYTGSISNLVAGGEADVRLQFYNFQGLPEEYVLSLYDSSSNEVAVSTAENTRIYSYQNGQTLVYYTLPIGEDVTEGEDYTLGITRTGKTLRSLAETVGTTAQASGSATVTALELDEDVLGGIIIRMENTDPEKTYRVSVTGDGEYSYLFPLYDGIAEPDENGDLRIVLSKNGAVLPASSYGYYLSASIYENNQYLGHCSWNSNGDASVYASASLQAAGSANTYDFALVGYNMLADIYVTEDLTFQLRKYVSGSGYVQIGETVGTIEREFSPGSWADQYIFQGTVTTDEPLESDVYYAFYLSDGDRLGGGRLTAGSGNSLDYEDCNLAYTEWNDITQGDSFWFNFGVLPATALLINSSGRASAQLIASDGTVAADSGTVAGTLMADGMYYYEFEIPQTEAITAEDTYSLRFVDGDQYVEPYYSDMPWLSDVVLPEYWNHEGTVLEGDTSVCFTSYDARNLTQDLLEECIPGEFVLAGTGEGLIMQDYAASFSHYGDLSLEITMTTPFRFGTYQYQFGSMSGDMAVSGKNTPLLGEGDIEYYGEVQDLYIHGCRNLPAGTYAARLYHNDTALSAEASVERVDSETLEITKLPDGLQNEENYSLYVWCNDTLMRGDYGHAYLYVESGGEEISSDRLIISAEYYYEDSYHVLNYETPVQDIELSLYRSGAGYVRYSEDKDALETLAYEPIRSSMPHTLSEGEGEKTLYIQFQDPDGTESRVYTYSCCLTSAASGSFEIQDVSLWVEDTQMEFLLPEYTEVTLRVVVSQRIADVVAVSLEEYDGIVEETWNEYPLEYVGPAESGGYLFETTFNSSDTAFCGMRIKAQPVNSYNYLSEDITFTVGELTEISFTDSVYRTNAEPVVLTGYASANSTLTLYYNDAGDYVQTTVGPDFKFSVELPAGLADGLYSITAEDSEGLTSGSRSIYIDRTAPVVESLKASTADNSGNATISWSAEDASSSIDYYLLWRNETPIITKSRDYSETSYIDVGVTEVGTVYKLVAVDTAGNQSVPRTAAIGDEIPPTQPGTAVLDTRTSGSITLCWAPSTDNFRVTYYSIYRDGELAETLDATVEDFVEVWTDSGLERGSSHIYTIVAGDAAGNESVPSEASTLSSAALAVTSDTKFETLYYRQSLEPVLTVEAKVADEIGVQTQGLSVKLCYQLAGGKWTEIPLVFDRFEFNGGDELAVFTGTWDISQMPVGTYTVRFSAADEEHTNFTESVTLEIRDDDVAPTLTLERPEANSIHGVTWQIEVKGLATDNVAVDHVVLEYTTDGETYHPAARVAPDAASETYYYIFSWKPTGTSGAVTVRATAYDLCGNTATAQQTIYVDAEAPVDATDFSAVGTSRYIRLHWTYGAIDPNGDFAGFNIYRSLSADGPFTLVNAIPQEGIGYYDDGSSIDNDTTYYYYITAIDDYGNESSGTAVVSASMRKDTESPLIGDMQPSSGAELCRTANVSVMASDNYRLAKAEFYWRAVGEENWNLIDTVALTEASNNEDFALKWDISDFESGSYQIRALVYDDSIHDVDEGYTANAPAERIRNVTIKAYSLPVAPALSVTPGFKQIRFDWTYDGDETLLRRFELQRAESQDGPFTPWYTLSAGTHSYTVKTADTTTYFYRVAAVDRFEERAESAISAAAPSATDTEAPKAVLEPAELLAAVGTEFRFSAASCTDNDRIVSWEWKFGDGSGSTAFAPVHTYDAAGEYTVQLTVTDESGNKASASGTITVVDLAAEDNTYTLLDIQVVDSRDSSKSIPNTAILISVPDSNMETSAVTDSSGRTRVLLPHGQYTLSAVAEGYLSRSAALTVLRQEAGIQELTIGLTDSSIITGTLTSSEMTLEEIEAAGIDTNDPDNQHVWKFATVLQFQAGLELFELPVVTYKNVAGRYWGGGWFNVGGGGGSGNGGGNLKIGVFPITEDFYMVIYGEARWLKEMYNVELVVMNNSVTDTIENCLATLDLPDGLSLASMLGEEQTAEIEIGTVAPKGDARAVWYVRGDKEGEYNLTAQVSGELVNGSLVEPFQLSFSTTEPLKVYAGSALHMTVTVDDVAHRGEQYNAVFKIENISDKSLYNFSFGITGIEQFKVTSFYSFSKEGVVQETILLDKQEFNDSMMQEVQELAPGGYIEIAISTTCWFNSDLEKQVVALSAAEKAAAGTNFIGTFVDVAYYLSDVSVVTLEGSTTSVPYSVVVNHVPRPTILQKLADAVIDHYLGDLTPAGIVGGLVEVSGVNDLVGIDIVDLGKDLLELQQGATKTTMTISIDDGTGSGNSLQNTVFSITRADGAELVFDELNRALIEVEADGTLLQMEGIKPGESMLTIEATSGDYSVTYEIPVRVTDDQITTGVKLTETQDRRYEVGKTESGEIIEKIQTQERSAYLENPYRNMSSVLEFDLEGDTSSGGSVTMGSGVLASVMESTALTGLIVNTDAATVTLDQAALEATGSGETEISIQTLEGTADPTYSFEVLCDDKALADFGDGTAEVAIAYEAEAWADPDTILVEQVLDDGTTVSVPSTYDAEAGTISFTTEHFSVYRIVRDYGVKDFAAVTENGTMSVTFRLDAPYSEHASVMVAVYDVNGRMLQLRQAALDNFDETSGLVDTQSVAVALRDHTQADHMKVFLLDKNSMPVLEVYREEL